jgi:arylsulfatase A-like enzyme
MQPIGFLENTLIIFSSDNGPVLNDGYYDDAVEKLGKHTPSGKLRGGKYSLFEAGTRMPFITYWKGQIKPGVSNAIVGQMDLLASIAKLVGTEEDTTDSQELLDVFLGNSDKGRTDIVLEATSRTALRSGDWLMIPPYEGKDFEEKVGVQMGNSDEFKLYNLKEDIGQDTNLAESNPEKLKELFDKFTSLRGEGYKKVD